MSSDWIDRLFDRLFGMYGQRFLDQWPGEEGVLSAKRAWSQALGSITGEEIAKALVMCQTRHTWPPSLPEFVVLCRPYLEPERAYREAVKLLALPAEQRKWSHPAIYWTVSVFGTFELERSTWEKAKTRWTQLLTEIIADAVQDGELPAIPVPVTSLPAPQSADLRNGPYEEMLQAKMKLLGLDRRPGETAAEQAQRSRDWMQDNAKSMLPKQERSTA